MMFVASRDIKKQSNIVKKVNEVYINFYAMLNAEKDVF